jgi:hypothetical protein
LGNYINRFNGSGVQGFSGSAVQETGGQREYFVSLCTGAIIYYFRYLPQAQETDKKGTET